MNMFGDIARTAAYEEVVALIEETLKKQTNPDIIKALEDLKSEVENLIQDWY